MKNNYWIGIGAIALGMFAYSRYAKKDNSGQEEDPNTGGGGGGGFSILPIVPILPVNPIVSQPARVVGLTPTSRGTVVVAAPTTQMNNPLQSGITPSGVSGTGTTTGSGSGTGTGTTTTGSGSGTSSTITYNPNDTMVRMFDGSEINCKTPIYLNDLVRSWNRP